MNFLKSCIVSGLKAIIGLFLIIFLLSLFSVINKSDEPKYNIGYLKAGAEYYDSDKNFYQNVKKVKVEVSKQKVITSTGKEVIQIYFLEGKRSGQYGYTYEENLTQ